MSSGKKGLHSNSLFGQHLNSEEQADNYYSPVAVAWWESRETGSDFRGEAPLQLQQLSLKKIATLEVTGWVLSLTETKAQGLASPGGYLPGNSISL